MDKSIEDAADQLLAMLAGELRRKEDAEGAVALYKTANWVIGQLEGVKASAMDLAEQDMRHKEMGAIKTPVGSAGWTKPKVKQLDEHVWNEALARDPRLMRIQREYDTAQAALEQAQEPYMELPERVFFIR